MKRKVHDNLNESYWAVLSCFTVYYAEQGGSNSWVCGWNPKLWPFKWKLLSSTFLWYCLLCCTRWFYETQRYNYLTPTFESVDEILECVHSNESYWAVPYCLFFFFVQGGSNFWSTFLIVRVGSSLSQWMKFLSASIKMIATEQCFNLQRLLFWKSST